MILRNGRCIFPEGIRDGLELVVRDGKIAEIRPQTGFADDEIVDLGGDYLAPGFIDLHLHGAVGRDTMEASADAFRAICDFHASGGTTSLLLTTASAPLDAIVNALDAVRDCRFSNLQIAGVHVEGPFISKTKAGAQRAEFIQHPTPAAMARLLEHVDVIKRFTIAPELPGALDAIAKFAAAGVSVSGGHSDCSDAEARAAFARGLRSTTHTFNCMSSARRDGIYRRAGLLEFALSEPEISCELIADGHHVSPTLMKMLYRAKTSSGICLVTDATAGAGLEQGSHFSLYGKDCIVDRGVCLLADRSALAGSAARMIDLVRTLVHDLDLPLHEAIAMATQNPARAIGLEAKGALRSGADADLVVLSPALAVRRTFLGGRETFALDRQ
ncbi:MAG TPA: N-acetylglucosamine-6-phosphate deacetylase [Chthoniobacterales bacterium]|nr:N-acetylglucosamine-6-phosphate deacetylase [Chthoniobacterales bacterium]